MKRNRKNLHKVTSNVLGITLASVMAAGTAAEASMPVLVHAAQQPKTQNQTAAAKNVYLDGTLAAQGAADGNSKATAVNTMEAALNLAGTNGTILVCGTVSISTEKNITIPAGVQIKRADGFTGAIFKVTGDGKLTISGNIQAADVDTSSANAGSNALQIGTSQTKAAVVMPSQITLSKPEDWSTYNFSTPAFSGNGTFSWQEKTAPTVYETQMQVVFTPKDTSVDYSKTVGWDNTTQKVVRTVKVLVESLKPQEVENTQNPEGNSKPEETETTQETAKPEDNAKEMGVVTIPETITLQKAEDWDLGSFEAWGFSGKGTFAWEKQGAPDAYQSQRTVIFTPSDTEQYDYSQAAGWQEETKTIVRSIQITIEEWKPDASDQETDKNTENDQNNTTIKPEQPTTDSQKPEKEDDSSDKKEESSSADEKNPDKTDASAGTEQEPGKEESSAETDKNTEKEPDKEAVDEADKGSTSSNPEDTASSETENKEQEEEASKNEKNEDKEENTASGGVIIEKVEDLEPEEEVSEEPEADISYAAQPGKNGETAEELPEALPVGSLVHESGVQVWGDFLPFYVDLQVSYNEAVNELPDAGIGDILSAYELKLWDLMEDEEYQLPEGKKVTVRIPLPSNANCFSDLAIAHYLGNNEYEYFTLAQNGREGNMTIEELAGQEYLVFETASFSPFNVGGHQIVGAGTISSGHKPSVSTGTTGSSSSSANLGLGSTGTTSSSGSSGLTGTNVSNNTSSSGNTSSSSSSQSSTRRPSSNTSSQNAGTSVVRTVRTGDEAKILVYLSTGIAALVFGAGSFALGKKRKKD